MDLYIKYICLYIGIHMDVYYFHTSSLTRKKLLNILPGFSTLIKYVYLTCCMSHCITAFEESAVL